MIESCIIQVNIFFLVYLFLLKECNKTTEKVAKSIMFEINEHWSEWQPCSVSCGIGFQLREKRCGDQPCLERVKQARTCNIQVIFF